MLSIPFYSHTEKVRGSRAHTYFSNSRRLPQQVFKFPMACPSCRNPAFKGTPISWAATPAVDIVSRTGILGLCQSSSSFWYLEGERRDERGQETIHKYPSIANRAEFRGCRTENPGYRLSLNSDIFTFILESCEGTYT